VLDSHFASFEVDGKAFLAVMGFCGLWWLLARYWAKHPVPSIQFPSVSFLRQLPSRGNARWAKLPRIFQALALAFFLMAFINPRLFYEKPHPPLPPQSSKTEGIALYFILDQSGSMTEPVTVDSPRGGREKIQKIALLKKLTEAFIRGDQAMGLPGRSSDLIGVVTFARSAQILSPLTLDHQTVLDQIHKLDIMRIKDQDGTAIGYAIYKTANLIAATRHYAEQQRDSRNPSYEIKNSVMILVTDGLQDPNPLDQDNRWRWLDPEDAAAYARDNHIRLYLVNVEPSNNAPEYQPNRNQMIRMAEMTGGKYFSMDDSGNLAGIYKEIDKLEKSELPVQKDLLDQLKSQLSKDEMPTIYTSVPLYPGLIVLGMVCLLVGILLQTLWLRSVP